MNQLPQIPGYTWRPLAENDEQALSAFEAVCAEVDGATKLRSFSEWQAVVQAEETVAKSRIAANEAGDVVADEAEWNIEMFDPVFVGRIEAVAGREIEPGILRLFPGC